MPTTAVGKLFKPALVEREIEETVRAEAKRVGAELSSVRVERDLHSGLRAVVAAAYRAEALRDARDRYAFKSQVAAALSPQLCISRLHIDQQSPVGWRRRGLASRRRELTQIKAKSGAL